MTGEYDYSGRIAELLPELIANGHRGIDLLYKIDEAIPGVSVLALARGLALYRARQRSAAIHWSTFPAGHA